MRCRPRGGRCLLGLWHIPCQNNPTVVVIAEDQGVWGGLEMFSVAEHVEQIRSQSLVLRREIKRHAVHGGGGGSLVKVLKVFSCDLLMQVYCGQRRANVANVVCGEIATFRYFFSTVLRPHFMSVDAEVPASSSCVRSRLIRADVACHAGDRAQSVHRRDRAQVCTMLSLAAFRRSSISNINLVVFMRTADNANRSKYSLDNQMQQQQQQQQVWVQQHMWAQQQQLIWFKIYSFFTKLS